MTTAYIYFVSISREFNNSVSKILSINARLLLRSFDRVLVVTDKLYVDKIACDADVSQERLRVINYENLVVLKSRLVCEYIEAIDSGTVKSNSPQTELHCLARWVALRRLFLDGTIDREEVVYHIDWDTLCMTDSFFDYIDQISVQAASNAGNAVLVATRGHFKEVASRKKNQYRPIYAVCPNVLGMNFLAVENYINYQRKFLERFSEDPRTLSIFYNDMYGFSCLISLADIGKSTMFYNLGGILPGVDDCGLIDENIRQLHQAGCIFEEDEYIVEPRYCYQPDCIVKIKRIKKAGKRVYIEQKVEGSEGVQENLLRALFLHFQGTEGKYILMKYFYQDLEGDIVK